MKKIHLFNVIGVVCLCLSVVSCNQAQKEDKFEKPAPTGLNIYWGDIHNHCNLTYGHGDMRSAFEAAKQQLDFVSVTPHAMWEDIPGRDDERLQWVVDYHTGAFDRLRAGGWDEYVKMTNEYNKEGEFVTFLSYESHNMKYGDHVVLNYDLDAPLLPEMSIEDMKKELKGKKAFITPHHMGYQEGFRGYNWDFFTEGDQTPFVEMFSRHGLAESDQGDYNYLHDMGPRQWESSIQSGLDKGHKFGIIGSTDQHAGYPGSFGDGRVAVLAKSRTRDAIWEALKNRHVYCSTGDKIIIDFRLNNAIMGDVVKGNKREIYVNIDAQSSIDYVDIVKNGETIKRISGPLTPEIPEGDIIRCKVRVEFGWNREEAPVRWDGNLSITDGTINDVTPCFRGAAYTSPQEKDLKKGGDHFQTKVNKILNKTDKQVDLEMYSSKNPNTMTAAMQAVVLDVTMPKSAKIVASFNGEKFEHTLQELLEGSKAHFMIGWLSEAISFNRAMPESAFKVEEYFVDNTPEKDTDYYYIRVRQRDQQWAWSTPIWVEKQ